MPLNMKVCVLFTAIAVLLTLQLCAVLKMKQNNDEEYNWRHYGLLPASSSR